MSAAEKAPRRRYAVLGTGAIGGYYGARLQQAGFEVHFLLHQDYDHVYHHGLRIDSVDGNFTLPQVWAYQDVRQMPQVDGVIVALKTTQNTHLEQLLPPLLGPETCVITLQNGLDIEASLVPLTQGQPILGGLCFICSNKVGPGHIRHLDYGAIMMGAYAADRQPGGITPALEQVAADFQAAGLSIKLTDDLYMTRWRKLAWNIPFNGLSVALDATTEQMMANDHARWLAIALMEEVAAAANACGQQASPGCDRRLPNDIVDQMLTQTAAMKPYRTSMKIDYDQGRPLETEAILGNPLRSAQATDLTVPRIEMLYHQLKALDRSTTSASAQNPALSQTS